MFSFKRKHPAQEAVSMQEAEIISVLEQNIPSDPPSSRKEHPWRGFVWFAALLSGFFVCCAILTVIFFHANPFAKIENTASYQNAMTALLDNAVLEMMKPNVTSLPQLEKEGQNIQYFVQGTGAYYESFATNTSATTLLEYNRTIDKDDPAFLQTYVVARGGLTITWNNHKEWVYGNIYESPYLNLAKEKLYEAESGEGMVSVEGTGDTPGDVAVYPQTPYIVLRVSSNLTPNDGYLWAAVNSTVQGKGGCVLLGAFTCVLLLLAVVVRIRCRRSIAVAHRKIIAWFGKLWLEPKLFIAGVCLVTGFYGGVSFFTVSYTSSYPFLTFLCLLFWWYLYLLVCDLWINRTGFFKRNIPLCLVTYYRKMESKYPFLEQQKKRLFWLVVAELLCLIGAGFCLVFFSSAYLFIQMALAVCMGIIFVGLGVFLLYRYVRQNNQAMDGFASIIDQVSAMKNGDLSQTAPLPPDNDFYPLSQDLLNIQDGIQDAVTKQVTSEKMKVELITNMSHDLKTPLTSIINYGDLLGQETLSPDYANEYVTILNQKAQRLSVLVQDLFDISKANSNNMELHEEKLDLCELVRQTLAELDSQISASSLDFRLQTASPSVYIRADGKRMHRVLENLIVNAIKYSLENTRVYIQIVDSILDVEISFKNIASYEMDFSSEEIVDRFTRGDKARSTSGSGLGLSIAKSFTEAMGGSLSVFIDGDLFKVTIHLPAFSGDNSQ